MENRCCPLLFERALSAREMNTRHCSVNLESKQFRACCSDMGPLSCQSKYFGYVVNRCCINSTALPDASGVGSGSTPYACFNETSQRIKPCCDGFVCSLKSRACQPCVGEGQEGDEDVDYDGCCDASIKHISMDSPYSWKGSGRCRHYESKDDFAQLRNWNRYDHLMKKLKG